MIRNIKYRNLLWLNGLVIVLLLGSCAGSKKASVRLTKINSIVKEARSYKGTPYRYGGTTRSGMDCSALLYNSFSTHNVSIPRTAKEQSKIGKGVSYSKLQAGDLVFFAAKKGRRKITHAGLVTKVTNEKIQFIHASTKLGVVEADLRSNYYRGIFVKARRAF